MLIKLIGLYRSQYWTSAFNTDVLQKLIKRDIFLRKLENAILKLIATWGECCSLMEITEMHLEQVQEIPWNDVYQM